MMRRLLMLTLSLPVACLAGLPKGLPCSSWPINIAEAKLQNAGIVKMSELDEAKTKAIPVTIEKIGKDLYKQVYDITWYSKSGEQFRAITVNNASSEECSMSGVTVYVVSRKIGADDRP